MSAELGIPEKMVALHRALDGAAIPHAFGGALALAWCVREVRATMDIDLNLFVTIDRLEETLAGLPDGVTWDQQQEVELRRDAQTRLRWGRHPVDVFFNTTVFHEQAATRVRWEHFAGADLPFLDCGDLAVFKAFFDRAKDWVDLAEMARAGALDLPRVADVLVEHLGPDDPRPARLLALPPNADR